ncbi:MAG: SgcJ/EcaC family oxidoreductase [Frankiaceae bacterium]
MASTDQDVAAETDPDKAALVGLTHRIAGAWRSYDADAFAGAFTESGTMILPGVMCTGRDEIRAFMAKGFEGPYKGSLVTGKPFAVRYLDDGVALLLTRGGVIAPGETEVRDDEAVRASWLAVKQDGEWRLAAYQNSPES